MRESVRGWSAPTLKRLRLHAHLTQADLAAMVGCSPAAIATWEGGRFGPQPRWAAALAQSLDVTVPDLVSLSREETRLRDLRAWAGLTQHEVQLDLLVRDIGAIERGTKPLPETAIQVLAQAYSIAAAELRAAADRTRADWQVRIRSVVAG